MPELPEVETIRLGLEKYLVGHRIENMAIRLSRVVSGDPVRVNGAKVKDIRRFGKGLVIDLDNGYSLAIHIKLTGQLIFKSEETETVHLSEKVGKTLPNSWTHVIFTLDKGAHLYYNDLRQFGWIKIIKTDDLQTLPFFKEMGPEPFGELTQERFTEIVKKSNTAIKVLMMDQKKIGGIGNIYANDSLWLSKIDPHRKAKTLTEEEIKTLYEAVLHVMKNGLKYGGASELNFVNALGENGSYQKHFLAYAQDGKPCQRCKTIMKKVMLGGRGTYYCDTCQV